jgi:hypothetical protein
MKTKILAGLVLVETIGLLALGWRLVDFETRDDGREFKSQLAMCAYLAQSYLKTQGKLVGSENVRWNRAIDVETNLYNLCLTPLTDVALRELRLTNLEKYQK